MNVAVVGAGAMGGLWAARLTKSGADVAVVDVAVPVVEAILEGGLTVEDASGSFVVHPRAAIDPSDIGPVDIVFIFTKAHHTRSAAESARPMVGPQTTIVSLQNGWGNADTIAAVLGPDRLVFGVTYQSAMVRGPGVIGHTSQGPTVVGPYVDDSGLALSRPVADLLTAAGLQTAATEAVKTEIWKKVVLNTATLPTSALSGLLAGELGTPGPMLDLADALAIESVAVLRAAGYDIDADERVEFINGLLAKAGSGRASMLQDVEARRKTEIEVINGAIVRQAERLNLDAPLNRAMVALIGGLERSWARAVA